MYTLLLNRRSYRYINQAKDSIHATRPLLLLFKDDNCAGYIALLITMILTTHPLHIQCYLVSVCRKFIVKAVKSVEKLECIIMASYLWRPVGKEQSLYDVVSINQYTSLSIVDIFQMVLHYDERIKNRFVRKQN